MGTYQRFGRFTPPAVRVAFWAGIRGGASVPEASAAAGVSRQLGARWFRERGGVLPPPATLSARYLSFDEREEIARLRAQGKGPSEIGRVIGRDKSTISRELRRVEKVRADRHRVHYKASAAHRDAMAKARRPKPCKLARYLPLRGEVQKRLEEGDSPEQIAGRLPVDFPDDQEMRVSHETIYQALYVQGRGALRRELAACLRTGRAVRKPRRSSTERRGRIPDMVSISERPAEAADRAVPGHWEGDLILGSTASGSAVGTLVERTTGFVMLLHLPRDHTAATVARAMCQKVGTLPEQLKRSITWDQGVEMAKHAEFTVQTGVPVYFCDPHSPWQRGSNENTNGLLRQYLPKGTDLSFYGPGMLDQIAHQ
ncbi:IS30 family transposase, partial [Cumulibacter manganitolerans]|uniref:IS30 family transposase n=1 Tax=Cumulibacter manganitolerans TaxID=1884992 RepID=UPI001885D4DC